MKLDNRNQTPFGLKRIEIHPRTIFDISGKIRSSQDHFMNLGEGSDVLVTRPLKKDLTKTKIYIIKEIITQRKTPLSRLCLKPKIKKTKGEPQIVDRNISSQDLKSVVLDVIEKSV